MDRPHQPQRHRQLGQWSSRRESRPSSPRTWLYEVRSGSARASCAAFTSGSVIRLQGFRNPLDGILAPRTVAQGDDRGQGQLGIVLYDDEMSTEGVDRRARTRRDGVAYSHVNLVHRR